MARHERSPKPVPALPLSGPLHLQARRDADGNVRIVTPPRQLKETVEAAERPPHPDDPRPAAFRNIPPFGGAA